MTSKFWQVNMYHSIKTVVVYLLVSLNIYNCKTQEVISVNKRSVRVSILKHHFLKTLLQNQDHSHNVIIDYLPETKRKQHLQLLNSNVELNSTTCEELPPKNYTELCPNDLEYFFPGICFVLRQNQTYPPSCPYQNFLPYNKIEVMFFLLNLRKQDIWIHAVRNRTDGFGHYVWTERGSRYGRTITNNVENFENSTNKDCLFARDGIFIPAYCSDVHQTLCVYSYEISKYCTNNFGKGLCVPTHLDFKSGNCYCKKKLEKPYPNKNSTCSKLAEPERPFQTHVLLQGFVNSEVCWIGLEKNNDDYVWTSTRKSVEYNYWSKLADCNYGRGALNFEEDRGWVLKDDGILACAFCEVTIETKNSTLALVHDRDILMLFIDNPFSISDLNQLYDIYCFTNANYGDFYARLPINNSYLGENSTTFQLQLPTVPNYPSNYWCKAFQFPENKMIMSNTIVAYNKTIGYGHEFALVLTINTNNSKNPLLDKVHVKVCKTIMKQLGKLLVQVIRPMKVVYFDENERKLEIVAHLTTRKRKYQIVSNLYYNLLYRLRKINEKESQFNISNFLSTTVCFANKTRTAENEILEWPDTNVGATAVPKNKLCLDSLNNMMPVTRECEGNFIVGAKWSTVNGDCFRNSTYPETTEALFSLLRSNVSSENLTSNLLYISEETVGKTPIDVHLISCIIKDIAANSDAIDTSGVIKIISNVMNFNRSILCRAQNLLNSTDHILSTLDKILANRDEVEEIISTPNIVSKTVDLSDDKAGVAFRQNSSSGFSFVDISIDTSLEDLIKSESLEAAFLLSNETLEEIKGRSNESVKVIVTVFRNDNLFNEDKDVAKNHEIAEKVLGVAIPQFSGLLKSPIQIIIKGKSEESFDNKRCSFWKYGWSQLMVAVYGNWRCDSSNTKYINSLNVCEFYHLTHFGLLLQNQFAEALSAHDKFLQILTVIGSGLSLIGIIPILFTAFVFKSWRSKPGTVILIQFSVIIIIQTLLLFISDKIEGDGLLCIVAGAGLHYSVLSEFSWMLVVAFLQYRRFVLIMKPPPTNILKKCALVGWGLPLFPVALTLLLSTANYKLNNNHFCYPSEYYFIFGLLLPVIIIFSMNAFIFGKIFYTILIISSTTVYKNRNFKKEALLALFLFFVLGMTWIFGLVGSFGGGIVFTYIFCLTATIRGLVLFIYFIIGNSYVRCMWRQQSTYYINTAKCVLSKSKRKIPH